MTTNTIDLTPTWRGVLNILLHTYCDGSPKGRELALIELKRMADLADRYVAEHKEDAA